MERTQDYSAPLNPRQLKTLNELLALGAERPVSRSELSDELREKLLEGTATAVSGWTASSLYVTKSQIETALTCEGKLKAQADNVSRQAFNSSSVTGSLSHRGIQLLHTHPGSPLSEYARYSLDVERDNEAFNTWWLGIGIGRQSEILTQATSKIINFVNDWPRLETAWNPRFEESLSAKVGHLTLSSRADLIIGRPSSGFRQTMLLCDLKSGNLRDGHEEEAMFYALVATLRYGVAPWRSIIYSLSSGEYTPPDVTEEKLMLAADRVIAGVKSIVAVMTETRPVQLTPGEHCKYCPVSATCGSSLFT